MDDANDWFGDALLKTQLEQDRAIREAKIARKAAENRARRGESFRKPPIPAAKERRAAIKAAAAAFEAVEKGAPINGTHPGYAPAGVKPTLGTVRGNERAVTDSAYRVDTNGQAQFKLEQVQRAILNLLQNQKPELQRGEASLWLTAITKTITDFTRGLDEELDE